MSIEYQQKLDILISHIHTLPSLPKVIIEIMQSFDDDNVDTSTLAKKIESDMGIVAKVLRVANSPFFGLSGQVSSIFEAIVVVGFNNLRGLVTSAAIINVLPKQLNTLDLQLFWQHSIRTAVCARILAKVAGVDQEAAFTAGLLHDVGLLVIGMHFTNVMEENSLPLDAGNSESLQFERERVGMDHATLGGEVAKYWHFPEPISLAIAQHHTSQKTGHTKVLIDVLYVANLFSHNLNQGLMEEAQLQESAQERLGIDAPTLAVLAREADQLYAGARMLIGS
jgi:putative nucleotidyltransferase with HDIG domain